MVEDDSESSNSNGGSSDDGSVGKSRTQRTVWMNEGKYNIFMSLVF